ncbi:glycoprotein Xg isoform B [Alligator mississippiensis]|uniref:Glycoprotein Xg isoform B n=1 Tax=Alligator mississippiensis TaxID=8496 RepID=A0A151NW49_ALLMI|nr:glycoprotein Xg isoform B [Alligator mississippiensis]
MVRLRATILFCLGFLLVSVRGQGDFDLSDALDHSGKLTTEKPAPPTKRPASEDSGDISDLDLNDGKPLPPRPPGEREQNYNHEGNTDAGLAAGVASPVVSAFVLLLVGSVAGYRAYKNKQLCFKPRGETSI